MKQLAVPSFTVFGNPVPGRIRSSPETPMRPFVAGRPGPCGRQGTARRSSAPSFRLSGRDGRRGSPAIAGSRSRSFGSWSGPAASRRRPGHCRHALPAPWQADGSPSGQEPLASVSPVPPDVLAEVAAFRTTAKHFGLSQDHRQDGRRPVCGGRDRPERGDQCRTSALVTAPRVKPDASSFINRERYSFK